MLVINYFMPKLLAIYGSMIGNLRQVAEVIGGGGGVIWFLVHSYIQPNMCLIWKICTPIKWYTIYIHAKFACTSNFDFYRVRNVLDTILGRINGPWICLLLLVRTYIEKLGHANVWNTMLSTLCIDELLELITYDSTFKHIQIENWIRITLFWGFEICQCHYCQIV